MASEVFIYQIMYGLIGLILTVSFFISLVSLAKHKKKPVSEILMTVGLLLLILETLIILIPLPATSTNMHTITISKLILKALGFAMIGSSLFTRLSAPKKK